MTQVRDDLGLDSLVAFLTTKGTEASFPTTERLTKASAATIARLKDDSATVDAMRKPQKITDADWRAMLYYRQVGILTATVKELKKFYAHPDANMQDFHIQDYKRRVLFEFAASIAVLARRCFDDELADQLLKREAKRARAATARGGNTKKSRDIAAAVYERGRPVRIMHPAKKPGAVANEILDLVRADLKQEKLVWKTVKRHLEANWGRLRDLQPLTKLQLKLPERLASRST